MQLREERQKNQVLPKAVAERWRHLNLPHWVAECCGLPPSASVRDLALVPVAPDELSRPAVDFFVQRLVKEHADDLAEVSVFPTGASTESILAQTPEWPARARTALSERGYMDDPESVTKLTYGQLLGLKGLGVKSVFQLGLTAEELSPPSVSGSVPDGAEVSPQGLDEATLIDMKELAATDWADQIHGTDPRFADLVPGDAGSLADIAGSLVRLFGPSQETGDHQFHLPYNIPRQIVTAASVRSWLADVRRRAARLEGLSLEELLSDMLERCSPLRGKRRDVLLARFGWSGVPPVTLEEAGGVLGVTRERIRQIERRVRDALPTAPPYVPALSRAMQLLASRAPLQVDEAAQLLAAHGVSKGKFAPDSVIAAASDLGLDSPIRIVSVKGVRLVSRAANTAHVSEILVIARKKAGASGVASAHDIAATVSRSSKTTCSVEDVSATLKASSHFRHLHGPWYWATDLPAGRNRLVNLCKAMLSVTSPIMIARLRDGVIREYMFRNLSSPGKFELRVPPAEVLRGFLRDHPDFVVTEDDYVRPTKPIDYRRQLGQADQTLVEVFRSSPSSVLDRATIIRECVTRGANQQTLNTNLTYSCLVEHVDTNIWTLRGSDVNPAAVEALRRSNALRPRERRVRDFGWTAEGCLWIAVVVPPLTQKFVFGCPAAARPYLAEQKFSAALRDTTPCGNVSITSESVVYGLSAFQQMSGCDPGDIVVIEFNLANRTAILMLGDEELLDRYSGQ